MQSPFGGRHGHSPATVPLFTGRAIEREHATCHACDRDVIVMPLMRRCCLFLCRVRSKVTCDRQQNVKFNQLNSTQLTINVTINREILQYGRHRLPLFMYHPLTRLDSSC